MASIIVPSSPEYELPFVINPCTFDGNHYVYFTFNNILILRFHVPVSGILFFFFFSMTQLNKKSIQTIKMYWIKCLTCSVWSETFVQHQCLEACDLKIMITSYIIKIICEYDSFIIAGSFQDLEVVRGG